MTRAIAAIEADFNVTLTWDDAAGAWTARGGDVTAVHDDAEEAAEQVAWLRRANRPLDHEEVEALRRRA